MRYDIAVLGAGISGLSLLNEALKRGIWADRQIVLLGDQLHASIHKRISFWSTQADPLPDFPLLSWSKLAVIKQNGEHIPLQTGEYRYYSIDAGAYRNQLLNEVMRYPQVQVIEATVESIVQDERLSSDAAAACTVHTSVGKFQANYVFQTIFEKPRLAAHHQYFLQHFMGWKISTTQGNWNPEEAIIMDYRTTQQEGTSFVYCLPASSTELFVEYTVFSKRVLNKEDYVRKLNTYLSEVWGITAFEILETEYGVIPMTDYAFPRRTGNVFYLGSAGGDTRGSTGYTFTNVQRTIDHILCSFSTGQWPKIAFSSRRKEQFYDAILLHVLDRGSYPGHALFTDLFKHVNASRVFKFLDAQSSFGNDLRIMLGLKKSPFILGMLTTLRKRIFGK